MLRHNETLQLETALEYRLESSKRGICTHYWGEAQYFLLRALCYSRCHDATKDLIGVLCRRFDGYDEWRFVGILLGKCGAVGSPLPSDRLEQISNNAWLGIITNPKIPDQGRGIWNQVAGHYEESSGEHFSRDLRRIAGRFPERFGRLALRFPEGVHPSYRAAILDAIKTKSPAGVPDEEKATWEPARIETIEAVIDKFMIGDELEIAMAFCGLIHQRPDDNWSERAVTRLLEYAIDHPDPQPDQLNVCTLDGSEGVQNATVQRLGDNSLNCVRGAATLAIGALLQSHPDWLERLRPGLEHSVRDGHPAVRLASVRACLPVLNTDGNQAVAWFCLACQGDLRIAACQSAVYFFNTAIQSHYDQLAPVILGMLDSPHVDVAQEGAVEVTARWLFHDMFASELTRCCQGNVAHRRGVVRTAANILARGEHVRKCMDILPVFFDDPEGEVRRELRQAFRQKETLSLPGGTEFVQAYINSQAYLDDPAPLLYAMEDFSGILIPYADIILGICDVFAGPLRDASRDISTAVASDASQIPPLLLRLYEQAQEQRHADIVGRCLDAWDILFEKRVGMTRELTKAISQ